MKFRIRRFTPGREPWLDEYEFEPSPGMTVLSALFHIQERLDDTLAFRYACRGAVCGSCAMIIAGVARLACRTQVRDLDKGSGTEHEITIEPLPNLPVLRDLVCDMSRFFRAYEEVRPFLVAAAEMPARENRMDSKQVAELELYTNCILCACCYAACPVVSSEGGPSFLGPAALAKLYRFHIDPRDNSEPSRLALGSRPDGWSACRFHAKCRDVCPRGVPPNLAIGKARAALKKLKGD